MKQKLLWIGDAGVPTGFGNITHNVLETVRGHFDVTVLGMNYRGDPHGYPYPIYPCMYGDGFGTKRMMEMLLKVDPDVLVIQQDPWNFPEYLKQIELDSLPVVGAVAVDAKNCRGTDLNGLSLAIFWTKFGAQEAQLGGYTGNSTVIPLGVDTKTYFARERQEARKKLGVLEVLQSRGLPPDAFIVGSVGRNQVRKRLDLTIQYFAEWVHEKNIKDAALWLHVAPTGEDVFDLPYLGKYYDIEPLLLFPQIPKRIGVAEETMAYIYSMMDVLFTTSQSEGWHLPSMEAMACGVPCIVPDWAATGEWPGTAALRVECKITGCTTPRGISSIHGIPDRDDAIEALDMLYRDKNLRQRATFEGLRVVNETKYRWSDIGQRYVQALNWAVANPYVKPVEDVQVPVEVV